jgi:hypothetical protein
VGRAGRAEARVNAIERSNVMNLKIERHLKAYLKARVPAARYTSFHYCFNYFQSHRESGTLPELLYGDALQLSCLQLGVDLASWGMLRGSSDFFKRSVRHLIPLVISTDQKTDAANQGVPAS